MGVWDDEGTRGGGGMRGCSGEGGSDGYPVNRVNRTILIGYCTVLGI